MAMQKWVPTTDLMILRRMGKTSEECNELAGACQRVIIQGLHGVDPKTGKQNKMSVQDEIADVMAQCECTIQQLSLDREAISLRKISKESQMSEWESMFNVTALQ